MPRWIALFGLGLVAALLAVPDQAFAWGPLAHLEFSRTALSELHLVSSPALRQLLQKCTQEFLYGSLAADIIVGKNLARYAVHCHNWKVGWGVFEKARGEPQQAFALGFLAHLAADTVAHNYFVPWKTVQGFPVRGTGHAYWEVRYDRLLDGELFRVARAVTRRSFRRHDDFLKEALVGSYVLPFPVSKGMFGRMLGAARMETWQQVSGIWARERQGFDLSLPREEVDDLRALAVRRIVGMIDGLEASESNRADPTGGRNLHLAFELRQRLRRAHTLPEADATEVVRKTRDAFRASIDGKVVLPDVPDGPAHELVEAATVETLSHPEAELREEAIAREEA